MGSTLAVLFTEGTVADVGDASEACAGDAAAFERLYRRHFGYVQRMARWLLRDSDVDDAVQDAFIRIWARLPQYRGEAAFRTWLHAVALSVLLRRRKSAAIRREREDPKSLDQHDIAMAPARPLDRIAMESAIEHLPPVARAVFLLHEVEGFPHAQVARRLGIEVSTSRSHLRRARQLLRARLSGSSND
jgi:RNA polymerase sigma-70 factor (ECF subfamily)